MDFTPEPWRISEALNDPIVVVDVQGVAIATVWRQPLDPPEWAVGNANLIANAPEMWAALAVITRDQRISAWLTENDPMALFQANEALWNATHGRI